MTDKEIFDNTLTIISSFLRHKSCKQNNILFRFGDRGENYYIILRGKVDILLAKPFQIDLNRQEYIEFLAKLVKQGEQELFKTCLHLNNSIYLLNDKEYEYIHSFQTQKATHSLLKENHEKISIINLSTTPLIISKGKSKEINYKINESPKKSSLRKSCIPENKNKKLSFLNLN